MFKRIDHVEIIPTDAERTIDFYTNILGFKMKERMAVGMPPLKEIMYLTLGDTMIEILSVENPAPASENPWAVGYRGMAIEVDNMEEAVVYLKEKGVPITWGPMDLGTSKRAEIQDPDGLVIELRQW